MCRPRQSVEHKLWSRVVKTEAGCWEWQGSVNSCGYGRISHGSKGQHAQLRVHRVSYEIAYGPIPDGLLVCHTCDNRRCVRPDHLWLGTDADNQRDKMEKGRHRWGVIPPEKRGRPRRLSHCKRGHPLEGDNLGTIGKRRVCRTCQREYSAARYAARKAPTQNAAR